MNLRNYRVPVPRKPPENAIEDSLGRKWYKVNNKEDADAYFTEWDGDYWYVWFQGKDLECPEEDEIINFKDTRAEVQTVHRSYRSMRAVVEIILYKDDYC